MVLFNDAVKDRDLEKLEALSDRELFRRWQSVGVRLADELPREFQLAFAACRGRFQDPPPETQALTLDNWELLGSKLIAATAEIRRAACAILVESLCALSETRLTTAEALPLPTRTFARIARIAERIVEEAEDYVKTDPEVDAFFIELEPDDAEELERLHQTHNELLIVALGMSPTEWAIGFPSVDLVQVQFGDRNFDIRVRQNN